MMGPALGFFGRAVGALNHLSRPSTLLFETGALTEASQQMPVSSVSTPLTLGLQVNATAAIFHQVLGLKLRTSRLEGKH